MGWSLDVTIINIANLSKGQQDSLHVIEMNKTVIFVIIRFRFHAYINCFQFTKLQNVNIS